MKRLKRHDAIVFDFVFNFYSYSELAKMYSVKRESIANTIRISLSDTYEQRARALRAEGKRRLANAAR